MKLVIGSIVPVKQLTPGSYIDHGPYRYRILEAELIYRTRPRVFAYEEHKYQLTCFDPNRQVQITHEVVMAQTGMIIYYCRFDHYAVIN